MPTPKKMNPLMELAVAEAEASPQPWREPELIPWTVERLDGTIHGAYLHHGAAVWYPEGSTDIPLGAQRLYREVMP